MSTDDLRFFYMRFWLDFIDEYKSRAVDDESRARECQRWYDHLAQFRAQTSNLLGVNVDTVAPEQVLEGFDSEIFSAQFFALREEFGDPVDFYVSNIRGEIGDYTADALRTGDFSPLLKKVEESLLSKDRDDLARIVWETSYSLMTSGLKNDEEWRCEDSFNNLASVIVSQERLAQLGVPKGKRDAIFDAFIDHQHPVFDQIIRDTSSGLVLKFTERVRGKIYTFFVKVDSDSQRLCREYNDVIIRWKNKRLRPISPRAFRFHEYGNYGVLITYAAEHNNVIAQSEISDFVLERTTILEDFEAEFGRLTGLSDKDVARVYNTALCDVELTHHHWDSHNFSGGDWQPLPKMEALEERLRSPRANPKDILHLGGFLQRYTKAREEILSFGPDDIICNYDNSPENSFETKSGLVLVGDTAYVFRGREEYSLVMGIDDIDAQVMLYQFAKERLSQRYGGVAPSSPDLAARVRTTEFARTFVRQTYHLMTGRKVNLKRVEDLARSVFFD